MANAETAAIIGASGDLGFGLTLRLGQAGVTVVVGSRSEERARTTVERARELVPGGSFHAATNERAVAAAPLVILAVPFRNQAETLVGLREAFQPGQLLIDTTVPLAAAAGGRATRTLGVWQGSAAQQAQELVGAQVAVVGALHTVSARALADLDHPLDEDVLVCGDDRSQKARAAALLERIDGLRCIDCGKLEMARIAESLTALLISVNNRHKTHAGIRLTRVPDERWEEP